jgi:hypothetical protein
LIEIKPWPTVQEIIDELSKYSGGDKVTCIAYNSCATLEVRTIEGNIVIMREWSYDD